MKQVSKTRSDRTSGTDQDEVQEQPASQVNESLDDSVCCILEDIDCCLADAESEKADQELAAKRRARDEWNACYTPKSQRDWLEKYQDMFTFGCYCDGTPYPIFEGIDD